MNSIIFNKNILSLSSRNNNLAIKLSKVKSSDTVNFKVSKKGQIIPIIKFANKEKPLHSSIDPVKEGQRFYNNSKANGFIIFLGLGAAYHIKPFLEQTDITEILIIDKDISLFKAILSNIDLSQFILNRRVKFLIDADLELIKEYLLSNYLPAVSGNLHILNLRSRFEMESEYFSKIRTGILELLQLLSADFSVQSHFGKRWFINTLSNLQKAQSVRNTLPPIRRALITGAGPSLEVQLPIIKEYKKDSFLIATDTSVPFLLKHDLIPDLVVSIDCQHISYHHFLAGFPDNIPLVLDLASPSFLTQQTDNIVFFTSGHPFSQFVNKNLRSFPYIDTSGGNVSHAAISLADKLGAKEILLFGVDFSYPKGKSYARGTYLYPYFLSNSNRLNPSENSFVSFIFYNKHTISKKREYGITYSTTPMISYKKRLEQAALNISAAIIQVPGPGETLILPVKDSSKLRSNITPYFSAGSNSIDWKDFLHEYRKGLISLPKPEISLSEYFSRLNTKQKDLCTTLYPAAAALRRSDNTENNGAAILTKAIQWTVEQINNYLC